MARRGLGVGFLVLPIVVAILGWLLLAPHARSLEFEPQTATAKPTDAGDGVSSRRLVSNERPSSVEAVSTDLLDVLVTADGAPVPDVQLTASRQQPMSSAWRPIWEPPLSQRTDSRGHAQFAAGPGTWLLSTAKVGFAAAVLDVVKPAGERVTWVEAKLERGNELRGLALDAKGSAIAPAIVRATPLGDRSTRRRSAPMGVVEATVDAKGAFFFSVLATGWWRLEGEAEGAGRADPMVISLPIAEGVKLRFRRSGFLQGVVVQPDGGPAPQALVVIGGVDGNESLEASATGTFSVERMPGSYRLAAQHADLVGTAEQVALVHAGDTTTTRIVLAGHGGTLAGTVKRDDGVPVEGALVIASPHNEEGLCGQATTAADGTFSIRGYPRGTYDLEAEAKGLMKATESGFFVAEGTTQHADLVLRRLGIVKGTVETSTGAPVVARVKLHSMRNSFSNREALSDSAGRFAFEDVPPGNAFITAARTPEENSRGTDVNVRSGATSEVKVILLDPVTLEVELDRSRCTPASEVTVVAMEVNVSQKRVQRLAPASTPLVRIQLSPGAWQLMGWDTNMKSCTLTGGMKPVTLKAGEKSSSVRLVFGPAEAMFEITVLESDGQPAPFASITASDGKSMWSSSADAEGQAQVGFEADSVMTLNATKQGRSAQMTGVRRSLGHATLTLRPAARIHLRLEGATGMTRIEAMLENDYFADELRSTGGEVWIEEIPAGSITLSALSADELLAGRVRVVTTSGRTAEASIRLQSVGHVSGKVQLRAGGQGAWVRLTSGPGGDQTPVASDGTFEFPPIAAGDYTVKVECQSCSALMPKPVSVAPGARIELQFP